MQISKPGTLQGSITALGVRLLHHLPATHSAFLSPKSIPRNLLTVLLNVTHFCQSALCNEMLVQGEVSHQH